jgi:E3 ubiquitin-protein ligase HUWE1
MSRASGKGKISRDGKTESVSSTSSEDEDDVDDATGREETPDLYRNSALGMYVIRCFLAAFADQILYLGMEE